MIQKTIMKANFIIFIVCVLGIFSKAAFADNQKWPPDVLELAKKSQCTPYRYASKHIRSSLFEAYKGVFWCTMRADHPLKGKYLLIIRSQGGKLLGECSQPILENFPADLVLYPPSGVRWIKDDLDFLDNFSSIEEPYNIGPKVKLTHHGMLLQMEGNFRIIYCHEKTWYEYEGSYPFE